MKLRVTLSCINSCCEIQSLWQTFVNWFNEIYYPYLQSLSSVVLWIIIKYRVIDLCVLNYM